VLLPPEKRRSSSHGSQGITISCTWPNNPLVVPGNGRHHQEYLGDLLRARLRSGHPRCGVRHRRRTPVPFPNGSVTGLDISPHALRYCSGRGCREVAGASVMALPFRDEAFDLVTSFDILYFKGIHDERALNENGPGLRPGGRVSFEFPPLTGCEEPMTSRSHGPSVHLQGNDAQNS